MSGNVVICYTNSDHTKSPNNVLEFILDNTETTADISTNQAGEFYLTFCFTD